MTTFDVLVELYSIAAEPWGSHRWFRMAPPTESSVARIEDELGLEIPEDYG